MSDVASLIDQFQVVGIEYGLGVWIVLCDFGVRKGRRFVGLEDRPVSQLVAEARHVLEA